MSSAEDSAVPGRWRYVIVVAKFGMHFVLAGSSKSLSVLIPAMVVYFNRDFATIGFLVSLQYGMVYLGCPLANVLTKRLGARLVAVVGAIVASICMVVAWMSNSVVTLGFLLFVTGLCSSPMRHVSSTKVFEYFGKKYGTMETITQLGSSAGVAALPFVTARCLKDYGLPGSFLIIGAVYCHVIPIAYSMREPRRSKTETTGYDQIKECLISATEIDGEDPVEVSQSTQNVENNRSRPSDVYVLQSDSDNDVANNTSHEQFRRNYLIEMNSAEDENLDLIGHGQQSDGSDKDAHGQARHTTTSKTREFLDRLSLVLDLRSLREEPIFTFLFLPCQLLFELSFVSWILFLVSYAVFAGKTVEEAAFLPLAASVGGLIGRGVVAALLYCWPDLARQIHAVSIGFTSVGLFLYPINSSLWYLMLCSLIVGTAFYIANSTYYPSIALVVKKKNFPGALSYSFVIYGLGITFAGPFAGVLYDITGSFRTLYIIVAILMAIVCVIFSVYVCIETKHHKRNTNS